MKAKSVAPGKHRRISLERTPAPAEATRLSTSVHLATQPKTPGVILLLLSPSALPVSPVPEQIWNLTTDHHIPPSQPRAPSSLCWVMQCLPHWALLPLVPCRACLPQGSRGTLQAITSQPCPQPSSSCLFHPDESKVFSQHNRVCLPPTTPALSPDIPLHSLRHRPSLFPVHISIYPPPDLCTYPSCSLKCSCPRYPHSCSYR